MDYSYNRSNPYDLIIFYDWFLPAYKAGGPIRSISNLIQSLKDQYQILVVSSNLDCDGSILKVEPNKIIHQKGYDSIYLSKNKKKQIISILKAHPKAALYYNNIYSYTFFVLPFLLANQKLQTLAIRGMLLPGAMSIKSIKKRTYLFFLRFLLQNKSIKIQASSAIEAEAIQYFFPENQVNIINNTPIHPILNIPDYNLRNRQVLMISRIHPIKNILFLKEIDSYLNQPIKIDIIGPIEDPVYYEKLVAAFKSSQHIELEFLGAMPPQTIDSLWQKYKVFISPSLNENFGQSIFESLANAVPVIVSKNTPWHDFDKKGVGKVLPFNSELWAQEICDYLNLPEEKYLETQRKVLDYSLNFYKQQEFPRLNRQIINGS